MNQESNPELNELPHPELTRILRTWVQAAVGTLVTFAAAKGLDLNSDEVIVAIWPIAVALTTWTVGVLERHVHPMFGLLNGPRRTIVYTPPVES